MVVDEAVFVTYSKDKDAVAQFQYWTDLGHSLSFWKRREKAEAKAAADEAKRRCITAGLAWDELPHPPAGLRSPDRSGRRTIGGRGKIAEELERAAAKRRAQGSHDTSNGANGSVAGSVAGGAGGALAGLAAYEWLSNAEQAHAAGDGSAWFQGSDGSLWFQDVGGEVFAWGGGEFFVLGFDGLLYGALAGGGGLYTWMADGTPLTLAGDGTLHATGQDGADMVLGEDGGLYVAGADGGFYTVGSDGSFWGVDDHGNYFTAPDGSGFSGAEFASADVGGGGDGDAGGFFDWI